MKSVTIRLDIPAAHAYLHIVSACLTSLFERIEDVPDIESLAYYTTLAVQEVCANIVDHALAHLPQGHEERINIEIAVQGPEKQLLISVWDNGQPFAPGEVNAVTPAIMQERGYGLFLVTNLMDKVTYRRQADANHWRLEKVLAPDQDQAAASVAG